MLSRQVEFSRGPSQPFIFTAVLPTTEAHWNLLRGSANENESFFFHGSPSPPPSSIFTPNVTTLGWSETRGSFGAQVDTGTRRLVEELRRVFASRGLTRRARQLGNHVVGRFYRSARCSTRQTRFVVIFPFFFFFSPDDFNESRYPRNIYLILYYVSTLILTRLSWHILCHRLYKFMKVFVHLLIHFMNRLPLLQETFRNFVSTVYEIGLSWLYWYIEITGYLVRVYISYFTVVFK